MRCWPLAPATRISTVVGDAARIAGPLSALYEVARAT
jgi:hypothetical protein